MTPTSRQRVPISRAVCILLGALCLSACGSQPAPSMTPSAFQVYRMSVATMSDELAGAEWDFHVAVRGGDTDEARSAAAKAVSVLERFVETRRP